MAEEKTNKSDALTVSKESDSVSVPNKTDYTSTSQKNVVYKEIKNILFTIAAALMSSFALWIFVYPAAFAPSGVDGIATMLYKLTGINAGYFSLMINLPLLIVAWFILNKKYVIYTVLFTALSSVALIVLEAVNFYQYISTTDKLLAAIFSGIILGVRTGIMLKMGASSGGVDIVACMVQKKTYGTNVERSITLICYVIILSSYLVYRDLNCILLSIVQMFVFEKGAAFVMKESRNAVEFKIITKHPQEIKNDIICNLKHGATIVESKGMYSGEGSSIVISVINTRQIPEFLKILKNYNDTFVYYSDVVGVKGNFRWFKDDVVK